MNEQAEQTAFEEALARAAGRHDTVGQWLDAMADEVGMTRRQLSRLTVDELRGHLGLARMARRRREGG